MKQLKEGFKKRFEPHYGHRFNYLTFLGLCENRGDNGRFYGYFKCDCGNIVSRQASRVISTGRPAHCGCLSDKSKAHKKHGMKYTPEYNVWQGMKNRCLNPRDKNYPNYGARGISVYSPWIESFETFYKYMGDRPKGKSIDRIDNNRGYEPGNVRWATPSQQERNTRTACVWYIKGKKFETVYEAAEFYGVTPTCVWRWVRGQLDKRDNKVYGNRGDCHAIRRY